MDSQKKLTVIIKITGNYCNLRCGYCFYCNNDQQEPTIMLIEMVENIIIQMIGMSQACTFIWHGGEPMLAGIDFFRKVVELQEKYKLPGQKIINGIQTNATLVTDEWADFFKINDFGVGVSLDGCELSHNRFRVRADGEGSFDDVISGVKLMQSKGVRLGYIQTVSKDNLKDLEENFRFFVEDLGAKSWSMNYFFGHDGNEISNQSVTPDEKVDHMKKCIDLWLARDDSDLKIREIESYFRPFLHGESSDCFFAGVCGSFICINWNGEIYPCDRFSNAPEYLLGNLETQTIPEILCSEVASAYFQQVHRYPEECNECRWLANCHNGCPHNRTAFTFGKYYYCDARKKIFSHVEKLAIKYGIFDGDDS